MKTITEALKNLNTQYAELDKIKKFMSTPKGYQFAMRLGREDIDQLIRRFEAPKLSIRDKQQKVNCYKYGATTCKLKELIVPSSKGFAVRLRKLQKEGKLKLPKSLTKEEMFNINNPIVNDIYGYPVKRRTSKGFVLWNARTNKPLYKRRRRGDISIGLAEKCHLYELHKMAKWDRKNPMPNSVDLAFTLFPEEEMASYQTRRNIALEHIRNVLSEKYYHCKSIESPTVRMYTVHRVIGYQGKRIAYEKECDPFIYGYPFAGFKKDYPSKQFIETKLHIALGHVQKSEGVIGLKVYDKFGTLRGQIAA